jgi:hypothetical protein
MDDKTLDEKPHNLDELDERLDDLLTTFLTFTLGNEAIQANPEFARADAKKSLRTLLIKERIAATMKFSGLWGIGGDGNEHVATYRRVYSQEMSTLQNSLEEDRRHYDK